MNTFLLYWNPHFSGYKVENFLNDFDFEEERDLLTEDDWGLPDDFNWSIVEHDSDKILSTDVLAAAIPEIDWTIGKAGTLINPELAEKIEDLWKQHIESIW